MKRNPWFRMYNEAIDDEKLLLLASEDRWYFVGLLCCKAQGIYEGRPETIDQRLAAKLRLRLDEMTGLKKRLREVGLIENDWEPCEFHPGHDRPPAHEWREIRGRIFMRDNFTCQYCGARGVKLECDHVHPVSKGGSNGDENLVTACFRCNRGKRSKTLDEWVRT